jgi:hypothetical protein
MRSQPRYKQIFSGLKSKSGIGHKKIKNQKIEILFAYITSSIIY